MSNNLKGILRRGDGPSGGSSPQTNRTIKKVRFVGLKEDEEEEGGGGGGGWEARRRARGGGGCVGGGDLGLIHCSLIDRLQWRGVGVGVGG